MVDREGYAEGWSAGRASTEDKLDAKDARIAELEAENEHLRNDYGDLDARLHLVTLDRDRCAAKAEALSRTGAVKGALEKLAALAERQKAYHNAKQHEFPSIEQCVDEEGVLQPDRNLYALLQGEAANGRYSEADWWLCTIRAEIADLSALEPAAPEDELPYACDACVNGNGGTCRCHPSPDGQQPVAWTVNITESDGRTYLWLNRSDGASAALKAAMEAGR